MIKVLNVDLCASLLFITHTLYFIFVAWMPVLYLPVPTFTCVSITVKLVAASAGANITSIKVSTVVVATSVVVEALIFI